MVIHKYASILLSNFWRQLWYMMTSELTCHEKTLMIETFSVKKQEFSPSPIPKAGLCKAPGTIGLGAKKMELHQVDAKGVSSGFFFREKFSSHQSEVPKPNPAQLASNAESLGHLEGTESESNCETAQSEAAV